MLNNEEQWKVLSEDFPNYECSTFGNIRNIKTKKILSGYKINSGYYVVDLYKKGGRKKCLVHRAIALAWIPNPENKLTVNHIDGNKENNSVSNLEWNTYSENLKHAFAIGLNKPNYASRGLKLKGQRVGNSKYYGVCFDNTRQKWRACVVWNKKAIGQKRFETEIEAARYRDDLVKKLNLEQYLPLNFV